MSLSWDGWTVAIGEALYDVEEKNQVGRVRVWRYNARTADWDAWGTPLVGNAPHDNFGSAVSLSLDGQVLAVGASGFDDDSNNNDNVFRTNVGKTLVFRYNNNDWFPMNGAEGFVGEVQHELSGWREAVTLSKTTNNNNNNNQGSGVVVVAIGAPRQNNDAGVGAGIVRIFCNNDNKV